jgi:hypothetical protein
MDDSLLLLASSRRPGFRAVAIFYLAVIKDTSYLWMHFKSFPPPSVFYFFFFQKLVSSNLYIHFLLDQSSVLQEAANRAMGSVIGLQTRKPSVAWRRTHAVEYYQLKYDAVYLAEESRPSSIFVVEQRSEQR